LAELLAVPAAGAQVSSVIRDVEQLKERPMDYL
jgi:hypothetical protein